MIRLESRPLSDRRAPSRAALLRYLVAATLGRAADGGAAVGLLLLCLERGDDIARPVATGGLLAAALTAPHLLGPLLARRLDASSDGRWLLAAAFAGYAIFLSAATVLLGHGPVGLVVLAVALAGLCGPLLTGGLSSRLGAIAGRDDLSRRRADGWDAVTYGVGGTLGPAAVAALAASTTAQTALLCLATAALVGGLMVLTLPGPADDRGSAPSAMTTRRVLRLLATSGPLRRVTYATMATAFALGGLAVLGVLLARDLGASASVGAALAATFGVGNLVGSLLVTVRPLRGEPEVLTTRWVFAIGAALGLTAAAPSLPLALVGFFAIGAANAPFFAATLAARSGYAPDPARAQVFVAVAAFKIAAGSLGTALAGLLAGFDPRLVLLAAAGVVVCTAAGTLLDRRASAHHAHRPVTGVTRH